MRTGRREGSSQLDSTPHLGSSLLNPSRESKYLVAMMSNLNPDDTIIQTRKVPRLRFLPSMVCFGGRGKTKDCDRGCIVCCQAANPQTDRHTLAGWSYLAEKSWCFLMISLTFFSGYCL